ncbi:hypothetical protein TELCIR_24171, partial [Teladorsagia circumcincta]
YELDGIENVPDDGSALFIYYHGCLPLDVYYLIAKLVLHKNRSLHCVGDKFIFKIPGNELFSQVGMLSVKYSRSQPVPLKNVRINYKKAIFSASLLE